MNAPLSNKLASLLPSTLVIGLLTPPALQAQGGGFAEQSIITTSSTRPEDTQAADLDGDGDLDVLIVSSFDDETVWVENLGGGVFGPSQVISTTTPNPRGVFAADLDGDSDADVLVASSSELVWHENLGGGAFGPSQLLSPLAAGGSVFAIDLDGDGDVDVLSASLVADNVSWYENLGGGSFGPRQLITVSVQAASDVFAADLDGDGDPDVLSTSFTDDKLAWYENLGGGSFGPQQVISTASTFYLEVVTADLDGDGDQDVLSASTPQDVAWHENLGGGSFGPQQLLPLEVANTRSVAAADFDGDGDQDVVAIGSGAFHPLAWTENLGGGVFAEFQSIVVGNNPDINGGQAVRIADFDGDGHADLLTASQQDDKILFWRNWPSVTTFGKGCGSFSVPVVFSPSSTATAGTPLTGYITHAPTALSVVAFGLSATSLPGVGALPFDLTTVGMAGCTLYQSTEVFGLATQPTAVPFIRTDFTGPAFPTGAVGIEFFAQAFCFAPGTNALGFVASNAIGWTVVQ